MPSLNSFETDMRKLRRRRRAKRSIKNITFITAVIVIAGLIYLSRDAWLNYFDGILERARVSQTTVQNDGTLAGGNFPIDISKKTHTTIGKMSKNWTLFADATFYVYTKDGDLVYSEQASYSNPVVVESDRRTLVYDQGGYSFMVAGPKKQIYSKRLTDQILLGAVGSDGSVAIVTSTDKYASYLTVYDKNGSEIYRWADGTIIMAAALKSNGSGCILASSYAEGGGYKTVITELDFESTEVVMQTSPIETLGFAVSYCDGDRMWLIGNDRTCRFTSDGQIEFNYVYDFELLSYSLNSKALALVFENVGGGGVGASVISADAEAAYELAAKEKISDVVVDGNTVYLCSETKIDAVDSAGNILATAPVDAVYREIAVFDDSIFLLGYRTVDKIEFER